MAIKSFGFASAGGGAGTDNLDDVTSRGATTTNAITVGGVTVGTEYSLPTLDGSANQVLQTNGTGTVSFATLDFTGGLEYKGAFNATAGTPSLLNAEKGDFYIIDTAGTIYGQTWAVGDHLLINEDMGGTITNSKIDKIDNTQAVTSVNTQTGAVVLSGNDLLADHTAVNYTASNNNIDGHLSGIDSALGVVASPTLDDVTTNGDTTTNAINVGTITTSGDILADADASRTIGAEATRFITYHGDMNGAIRFKAKNNQGSAITKGQVVYISGVSGTVPEVKLAQANSALTMPAFGLALNNANDQAEVQIITFGNLTDYNTTTYSLSANDTVYVSATTAGALTNSAPTGESNLIQNIGRVVRADASAGIIKVGGAGRSNATPNLDQDKIFLGNASNQSVSTALSAIGLSKFNNDSGFLTDITSESLNDLSDVSFTAGAGIDNYVLTYDNTTSSWGAEVVPSAPVTSVNTQTGAVVVSGNDILADHTAVNYTASNNNVDGHFSGVDTKLGTLLADITSESLNDLSDVSFTAGAGIDNYVLTYDNSTSSWGAEAASGGGLTYTIVTLSSYTASANTHAHYSGGSSNTWTVTLPATSSLSSGDVFVFSRAYNGSTVINKNAADSNCIIGVKSVSAVASVTIDSQPSVFYFIFDGTNFRQAQSALGSGAELDADNTANNLVKLDFLGRLPAIDGSQLSNLPYVPTEIRTAGGTSLSLSASLTNLVYWLIPTASATFTITLPLTSTLSDGDSWTIQRQTVGDLVIQQNGSDTGAKIRFGASDGSSHTINAPGQSFLITYDATSNKFYIFDQVFLQEISTDTTPQLGGNLDVNGNDIVSASNGDIEIAPDGTGSTIIKGNAIGGSGHIVLNCEQNSHGITLKGPPHSAAASYTLTFPNTDGDADQVLKTDGSGNLEWVDQASGGYTYSAITADPANAQYNYHYSCTGTFTVTLPASASGDAGKEIRIKNMGTGTITVDGNASETIDGQTTIDLDVQYSSITLIATGNTPAAWEIV